MSKNGNTAGTKSIDYVLTSNTDAMASVIFRAIATHRERLPPVCADRHTANRLLVDLTPVHNGDAEFVERVLDNYIKSLPITNPDVPLGISTLKYLRGTVGMN